MENAKKLLDQVTYVNALMFHSPDNDSKSVVTVQAEKRSSRRYHVNFERAGKTEAAFAIFALLKAGLPHKFITVKGATE